MSTAASMKVSNELQGIGSVLGSSEYQRSKTAASLRRTLSADMSSKKWLSKNGFCPLKRIASSEDFQVAVDEDDSKPDMPSRVYEKTRKEEEPPGQSDIWSSIMSEKLSSVPTTYVHPLAKRSRPLNQQSLEICTESLGSETGSDGFSSPPSENSDDEQGHEEEEEAPVVHKQEFGVVNYNSYAVKKSPSRSFPPPLPSLSQSGLQVRSHRIDGRLVLEAVPVPVTSNTYFQAQREGGRLLLIIANTKYSEITNIENTKEGTKEDINRKVQNEEEEEEEEEEEYMFQQEEYADGDSDKEECEEEDSEEENEQVMDRGIALEMKVGQPTKLVPTGVMNVHRSALMVNKLMGLTNIDPTWSPKLEKLVDLGDEQTLLTQSLPPLANRLIPAATAASSFNTYNYCWRTKSAAPTVCTHPLTHQLPPISKSNKFLHPKNLNTQEEQELVLKRSNKLDHSVQFFKGCKESRRSLFWEPHCITTT